MGLFGRLVIVCLIVLLGSGTTIAEKVHRYLPSIEVVTPVKSETTHDRHGSETIVVSTYEDNGLLQRIKNWWMKILESENSLLPGIGARHGAIRGTVTISDENGDGTLRITVHNDDALFKRVAMVSDLIIQHELAEEQKSGALIEEAQH